MFLHCDGGALEFSVKHESGTRRYQMPMAQLCRSALERIAVDLGIDLK